MAQTILQEIEAGALGAIISGLNTNQATVLAWFQTGETEATQQLANLLKLIPSVKGTLAIVVGPVEAAIEAAIEAYAASVVAKYPPQQLFDLLIALLTKLQGEV